MISVSEAQALILTRARSFGTEKIPLERSFGRVLADDVFADRDYPPFNRAAMDGYAVVAKNYATGHNYPIEATVYAGDAPPANLPRVRGRKEGEMGAMKIMTGGAVPAPFDAVIRREDARETDRQSVAFAGDKVPAWHNISRQGEDLRRGEKLPLAGRAIDQATVTLLASLGIDRPLVRKLPRVTIITTGNEIVPVNKKPKPTQIRNANALALRCMLARFGIERVTQKHVADDKAKLRSALQTALAYDVVLLTGGVSAGDSDYVPEILQALRVKQIFHKTAMKPGKPLWFGARGKTSVFAIPGNPFSAQVVFRTYVAPYLHRCFGMSPPRTLMLPIAADRRKKDSLQHYFPVRVATAAGHCSALEAIAFNGSGDIRAGWGADGLAVQPAQQKEIHSGELVEFMPW